MRAHSYAFAFLSLTLAAGPVAAAEPGAELVHPVALRGIGLGGGGIGNGPIHHDVPIRFELRSADGGAGGGSGSGFAYEMQNCVVTGTRFKAKTRARVRDGMRRVVLKGRTTMHIVDLLLNHDGQLGEREFVTLELKAKKRVDVDNATWPLIADAAAYEVQLAIESALVNGLHNLLNGGGVFEGPYDASALEGWELELTSTHAEGPIDIAPFTVNDAGRVVTTEVRERSLQMAKPDGDAPFVNRLAETSWTREATDPEWIERRGLTRETVAQTLADWRFARNGLLTAIGVGRGSR